MSCTSRLHVAPEAVLTKLNKIVELACSGTGNLGLVDAVPVHNKGSVD